MSTVAALLSLVDSQYPNSATDATVVSYFNLCQDQLSSYFGKIALDNTTLSAADDEEYAFPSGIDDISQIDYIELSDVAEDRDKIVAETDMTNGVPYTIAAQPSEASVISITHTTQGTVDTLGTIFIEGTVGGVALELEEITVVANSTVYGTRYFTAITTVLGYDYATVVTADHIKVGVRPAFGGYTKYVPSYDDPYFQKYGSFYQSYDVSGNKTLVLYPAPTLDNQLIRIRYRKRLTALSSSATSASPDFDSRYHSLLATYACYKIASSGASPDTVQSNMFLHEYEEVLNDLWKERMTRQIKNPLKPRDNRHWHSSR